MKCNDTNPLKLSIADFYEIIKNTIKRSKDTGIKPLKFKDTLQHKNNKLFDIILGWEIEKMPPKAPCLRWMNVFSNSKIKLSQHLKPF